MRSRRFAWVLFVSLFACLPVAGKERVQRLLDQRDGLPVSEITRLAQDSDGFIWIGTFAGLIRYDGNEMRPWAPDQLHGFVSILAAGPTDVVVAAGPTAGIGPSPTPLYRILAHAVTPVVGPDGGPLIGAWDASYSSDGRLCVARGSDLVCRQSGASWSRQTFLGPAAETVQAVRAAPDGAFLVITSGGVWLLSRDMAKRKLFVLVKQSEEDWIFGALAHPDGSIYVAIHSRPSRVERLLDGKWTQVLKLMARPIDLVVRGQTVWASFDRYLARLPANEPPELIGPDDGLPSGGPLLVDQEESLWLGTVRGIIHFPEPDTVAWTDRDGLPSGHARFLLKSGKRLWVSTWQGLGTLEERIGLGWRARIEPVQHVGQLCLDRDSRLWLVEIGKGFITVRGGRTTTYPEPRLLWMQGCDVRPDGTVWLFTSRGLYRTPRGPGPPHRVASQPPEPAEQSSFFRVLEDRSGTLWVGRTDQICQAPALAVARDEQVPWSCQSLAMARGISSLLELDDGTVWAGTDREGVWRFANGQWTRITSSDRLVSLVIHGLTISPKGGVWILGQGIMTRVKLRPNSSSEWDVLEELTSLQGLPGAKAEDLVEEEDGSLWVATVAGVVHVPARARQIKLRTPVVKLVELLVNGERVASDPTTPLIHREDLVELRFAALSFRDRSRLRYQFHLKEERPWREWAGFPPILRLSDLPQGSYTAEVRSSLDGRNWSSSPARVSFQVLPPWYLRAWALALFAGVVSGLLYLAHALRTSFLLRLERQRMQIAMDLHDEIGSGLGSIRILAGLAGDSAQPEKTQAGLIADIAESAGELGAALGEMVWSLRARSGTLEGLATHLSERASRFFPGGQPAFAARIPDLLPRIELSLPVRRNVALIALEALHNAARHAEAKTVELGLAPQGRKWCLWVSDDGRGFDHAGAELGDGLGFTSMRRRAEEIGAEISWSPNGSSGTRMTLVFDPQAEGGGLGGL